MKKRNKFAAFIIGLLRVILALILLCSLFGATASVFLSGTLFNRQFYKTQLTNDEYISELHGYIGKEVKSSSLYYGLPYDELMTVITADSVKDISAKYADAMYDSLTTGEKMAEVSYPADEINSVLTNYFTKEKYDVDNKTVQLIADDLAATVSANIVVIKGSYGSVEIFKPLSKYLFANKVAVACANATVWSVAACCVLTVLSFIFGGASLKTGLYNVANVYWLAGCIMFIPISFLKNHDIFSKIALSDSPMKAFVGILGNPAIDKLLSVTRVVFIIACVILAVAISVYVITVILRYKNKKNATEDNAEPTENKTEDKTEEPEVIKSEEITTEENTTQADKPEKQTESESEENHETDK